MDRIESIAARQGPLLSLTSEIDAGFRRRQSRAAGPARCDVFAHGWRLRERWAWRV